MVTTTAHYTQSRYRAAPGDGLDGVVRVSFGGQYASGSLLWDGRAVLTAAHLFGGQKGSASTTKGLDDFNAHFVQLGWTHFRDR